MIEKTNKQTNKHPNRDYNFIYIDATILLSPKIFTSFIRGKKISNVLKVNLSWVQFCYVIFSSQCEDKFFALYLEFQTKIETLMTTIQ